MTDMIEKVAKAIAREHFARRPHVEACSRDERLDFLANTHWRTFVPAALAAIEAMRESTEEASEEGGAFFKRMLREALKRP